MSVLKEHSIGILILLIVIYWIIISNCIVFIYERIESLRGKMECEEILRN